MSDFFIVRLDNGDPVVVNKRHVHKITTRKEGDGKPGSTIWMGDLDYIDVTNDTYGLSAVLNAPSA